MKGTARIGEIARLAGVSVQAIRYYERLGLLPPAPRTASRYRVYSPKVVGRLKFIRQAQCLGFRLEEVREILRMKYAGQSPCGCVRKMLEDKLVEVERTMAELSNFRRALKRTIGRARRLPARSHRASAICPVIQPVSTKNRKEQAH